MTEFVPKSENYILFVQKAFDQQGFMKHLGVEIADIRPGYCELHYPIKKNWISIMDIFMAG